VNALCWQAATLGYPGHTVLENVTLDIKAGSCVLVRGENGSGKTTLLASLHARQLLSSGRIILDPAVLGRIACLTQHDSLDPELPLSIEAVMRMGTWHGTGWIAGLLPGRRQRTDQAVAALLEALQLDGCRDRLFRRASGGERKKALLARELLADPRLLLLDEPFAGIDEASGQAIGRLLAGLRQAGSCTILLVTHDERFLPGAPDRIIEIGKGKIHAHR
jgi:ABC-type Mn2+/Zn2+ transport system ATPase subunit